jgi:hypothetical protein
MNDFFLTTVESNEADEKYINTLARVLIPTVVKLVDQIHPASMNDETVATEQPEPVEEHETEVANNEEDFQPEPQEPIAEETIAPEPEPIQEELPAEEPPAKEEGNGLLLPEPPVTQFIIENLGGLLVPSDTVRIDSAVITQWNDLYGDKKLEEVEIETLMGKVTRCKFKPIKDSKYQGKGIIQMPEKIQLTLESAKGELVMVKPVVE